MSAPVVDPPRIPVVRIIARECEKEYSEHKRCPGTIRQTGVTFVCQCACHRHLPLFEGTAEEQPA